MCRTSEPLAFDSGAVNRHCCVYIVTSSVLISMATRRAFKTAQRYWVDRQGLPDPSCGQRTAEDRTGSHLSFWTPLVGDSSLIKVSIWWASEGCTNVITTCRRCLTDREGPSWIPDMMERNRKRALELGGGGRFSVIAVSYSEYWATRNYTTVCQQSAQFILWWKTISIGKWMSWSSLEKVYFRCV
jgi:hypothetical protein